jgi:hypothetical protein
MRKKRGVKPGVPDVLVWYCGKSITIELKSRRGQCSPSGPRARRCCGRARDGLPYGARGDVGVAQVGREVSYAR